MKERTIMFKEKEKTLKVNVSQIIRKILTGYGRDNTRQAEMRYFHCDSSRQENFQSNEEKIKK